MTGLVQGVGFRPYVWRLATALGLGGWVRNSPGGVIVEVQGPREAVEVFTHELGRNPPRLASVDRLTVSDVPLVDLDAPPHPFTIAASESDGTRKTVVSPDVAICDACREEVRDPSNRRHGYPFTNCTDCGPRYSIIEGLPYDRSLTSMRSFAMCPDCREEYEDPADRRFHAQPNACPECGPYVWIQGRDGGRIAEGAWRETFLGLAKRGAIFAVKGLGGFHLACDARNEEAVARLRARKRRPAKPFAVMARDIRAARRYVTVGPVAERLLLSPAAPIVVLPLRPAAREPGPAHSGHGRMGGPSSPRPGVAAPSLAPGSRTLGVMLPYTPLHLLLFDDEMDLLVMTSANRSDLPIVRENEAARTELAGIADYYLFHDRDIVNRCEDSVVRVHEGGRALAGDVGRGSAPPDQGAKALVIPYRRSRGYAPAPLDLRASLPAPLPACAGAPASDVHGESRRSSTPALPVSAFGAGGEMKGAFCLVRDAEAFLSPHLGEIGSLESLEAYKDALDRYLHLLGVSPNLIAYDPHPGYLVSRFARRLIVEIPVKGRPREGRPAAADSVRLPDPVFVPVYHHHAHMVSCLADNGLPGDMEVLSTVCDGTGHGPDGTVWGFEILRGTASRFSRLGHLACTPMPGGDVTVRRPYRSAVAHLLRGAGLPGVKRLAELRPHHREEIELTCRLLTRATKDTVQPGAAGGPDHWDSAGLVVTSSCGRLYDAVAAIAGLTAENTYEGEAAVLLSEQLEEEDDLVADPPERYRFTVVEGRSIVIDPRPFLTSVLLDLDTGEANPRRVAILFHQAMTSALNAALSSARRRTGLSRVVLSGGTFQNPHLVEAVRTRLLYSGFEVFTHRRVPPNDGGLALGQVVAAAWMASARATGAGTRPH